MTCLSFIRQITATNFSVHKVALNGRFTGTPQPTGTQTAAYSLFEALVREPRDCELVLFADERFLSVRDWAGHPGVQLIGVPFQDWSRERAHFWEQVQFPVLARRHGCRVAHHPITTSPLWHNGVKSIVTLHDLNFYRHPEWFSRAFRLVYALCAVPGLKRAHRVVTISDYVRDQAREDFHLREDRLRMIHNGVKPLKSDAIPEGRYLLCVGSLQPHKNLARMIKAFIRVREDFPGLELRVVGRPQPRFTADDELPDLLSSDGVSLLGYLSEQDLANAYAGAEIFCYPSLEEGFGLPVLEAMTLGTLVLTSNVSCLPEIAGPAMLVDPYSVEAMAQALGELLRLPAAQRAAKVGESRAWAAKFTWSAAARGYLKIYEEVF